MWLDAAANANLQRETGALLGKQSAARRARARQPAAAGDNQRQSESASGTAIGVKPAFRCFKYNTGAEHIR